MAKVNNEQELRSTVSLTTAQIHAMCNAKTITELCEVFYQASTLLVDMYRYKVEELRDKT